MPYSPLDMADAFIKAGELTDALDVLNTHLDSQSNDDEARRLRAQLLMRLPGNDHLEIALDDLKALSNPDADDYVRQSVILERVGAVNDAARAMVNALKVRPADERITERYLGLLMAEGSVDQARALLDTLPQTWRWMQWRGDLAEATGAYHDALTHYTASLSSLASSFQIESDWVQAIKARLLLARAQVYTVTGDYDSADEDYAAAQELIADDPLIPFNRGLLLALRGNNSEAITLCREAYVGANDTLKDYMASALRDDTRYREIEAKVLS